MIAINVASGSAYPFVEEEHEIKHVALKSTDKISDVSIQLIFCISQ